MIICTMLEAQLWSSYIANCVFNAFLCYAAILLNIITIHAIRKTSSLPKTSKTLLLSLAISDLGAGLAGYSHFTLHILLMTVNMEQYNWNQFSLLSPRRLRSGSSRLCVPFFCFVLSVLWLWVQTDSWPFIFISDTRNLSLTSVLLLQ